MISIYIKSDSEKQSNDKNENQFEIYKSEIRKTENSIESKEKELIIVADSDENTIKDEKTRSIWTDFV